MEVVMSRVIVKVGGVAAALAGVLIIAQEIWDVAMGPITEGVGESAVHSTWVLLLVFGVLGLHLHQQHAAGVFGEVATLIALFGLVALFAAALTEVTMMPALPESFVDEPPPAMLAVFLGSFVAYVLGLLLFGIATWRAGVLPRRAAALLVIGIVLALALKSVVPGVLLVFGVALVWLGGATVTQARPTATEAEPAALART
jgi:hypothetical protein